MTIGLVVGLTLGFLVSVGVNQAYARHGVSVDTMTFVAEWVGTAAIAVVYTAIARYVRDRRVAGATDRGWFERHTV